QCGQLQTHANGRIPGHFSIHLRICRYHQCPYRCKSELKFLNNKTMFLLHHHRRFTFGLLLFLLWGVLGLQFSLAQQVGDRLTDWQEGYLDIHHINTGKGESAFFIFPDGTTALVDAGDHARPPGPREVPARPDDSRMPGEWIARYIQQRSEEHTSELQSRENLVCRLLLEKKKTITSI